MNTPTKSLLLLVLFVVSLLSFGLLACDFGPEIKEVKTITVTIDEVKNTVQDANNSCNDITSCVGDTPNVISNLCEVTGNTRDTSGNCVSP